MSRSKLVFYSALFVIGMYMAGHRAASTEHHTDGVTYPRIEHAFQKR